MSDEICLPVTGKSWCYVNSCAASAAHSWCSGTARGKCEPGATASSRFLWKNRQRRGAALLENTPLFVSARSARPGASFADGGTSAGGPRLPGGPAPPSPSPSRGPAAASGSGAGECCVRRRGAPGPGHRERLCPAPALLRATAPAAATAAPGRSTGPWVGRGVRGPAGSPGRERDFAGDPRVPRGRRLSSCPALVPPAGWPGQRGPSGRAHPLLSLEKHRYPALRRCGRERAADLPSRRCGRSDAGLGQPRSWGSCLCPAGRQCCQLGTPLSALCLCPSSGLCSGTWGDRADSFQSWQSQR